MSAPTDLFELTTELVGISSLSHAEGELANRVEQELRGFPWLHVDRLGDNVVARTNLDRARRVIVAGHLDTVPANNNASPRVDGDVLWGLGASDMKGGLAVMLDLARELEQPEVDVTWCFYACEEVGRDESGLGQLWAQQPEWLAGDVAILGEPTAGLVEAGCQGTLTMAIHLGGVRAHSARPFTGINAIHRLTPVLVRVAEWPGRTLALDGCEFAEQLQAVDIRGGIARNVVPDAASLTVNYRFAPDRDGAEAKAVILGVLDGLLDEGLGDRVEVLDVADGAPPSLDDPLLKRLVQASGASPKAKVGWTDVASFWAHGVPAANFGPGDPLLAHHPDERVERAALERARVVLSEVLGGS